MGLQLSALIENKINLCAVGDLSFGDSPKMLGLGVRAETFKHGGDYLFSNVQATLNADLVFGNLEGVLSDQGYSKNSFHYSQLRGHPFIARVMNRAGFNVVNVANNHMMQYGPEAFIETYQLLIDQGISVVGLKGEGKWWSNPAIININGVTVGFLGYADSDKYGFEPLFALNLHDRVLEDVSRLRPFVDILIVSLHWGDEFIRAPSCSQREYAETIIDTGVDLILGHHSHVIQGVESYRNGWICYSLGNFISDMVWNPRTCEGLMTFFTLDREGVRFSQLKKVLIGKDFKPTTKTMNLEELRAITSSDEAMAVTCNGYEIMCRSRIKENRKLAHLFLFANFFRYSPMIFIKTCWNSFLSFLGVRC